MTTSDRDSKPKPAAREQKLAQALRANLRRRKAGERLADRKTEAPESADED